MVTEIDEVKQHRDAKLFDTLIAPLKDKKISLSKDDVAHVLYAHLLDIKMDDNQTKILNQLLKEAPNALQVDVFD